MEIKDLNGIISSILDEDAEMIVLTEDTTIDEIEDWDSLTHLKLFSELEKVCGVKFSTKDMMSWETMGELIDIINSKRC